MHIGLIGGIGPGATDYYYRGLIQLYADAGRALDLTIAHADARQLLENLTSNAPEKQADVFVPLIERLAAAGAGAAAVTSMAGHFCSREVEARSVLPLIDALPAIDAHLRDRNLRTVGILGTRMVMETRLYGRISSSSIVLPEGGDLEQVHRAYVEMAVAGRVTRQQREVFFSVGQKLCRERGAEAVMLGGTDLSLAFDGQESGFETVDCASVHIEAIYRASIATASSARATG